MEKNYYEILGVERTASQDDIKKAYRKLSKKYHPDVCKEENAQQKFAEINEAFHVLSDPKQKETYDRFGTTKGPSYTGFTGPDPDMYAAFMEHMKATANKMATKGADLRITINCTLEDLYNGVHKKIKMKRNCTCHHCHGTGSEDNVFETCPNCHGTGRIYNESVYPRTARICMDCMGTGKIIVNKCPVCHGTGIELKEDTIEFDIPANMPSNADLSMRGKGHAGERNGIPGNLIIKVIEIPNEHGLVRDGDDLMYKMKVSYTDLIFGKETKIPWVTGLLKFNIKPGTESGHTFMLRGKGMPNLYSPEYRGDFLVTVDCEIPKIEEVSEEEKKILNELKDIQKTDK